MVQEQPEQYNWWQETFIQLTWVGMNKNVVIAAAVGVVGIALLARYYLVTPEGSDVATDCAKLVKEGFLRVAFERQHRFLGKVEEQTANCRGGEIAVEHRDRPWVDWPNYWGTGDESSNADKVSVTGLPEKLRNDFGVQGALMDLEYQRIELIHFNLFDNSTYEDYVKGRGGQPGPVLKTWPEMRLPPDHPDFAAVGGAREQVCKGKLVRGRTLTGICNDVKNPAMGSSGQLFARNTQFEETFPDLEETELTKNRHGGRLALLKPDPQLISRRLFTRMQPEPAKCNAGHGLTDGSAQASCEYRKAPFFNVLAAYWIQFMTHDWFSHLVEGRNSPEMIGVGCESETARSLGCRPDEVMEKSLVAQSARPGSFEHNGKTYRKRARKTTRNGVTAWWDLSQIYGYDEVSAERVRRDPNDAAKLLMNRVEGLNGEGDLLGYLPGFKTCPAGTSAEECQNAPVNPEWRGQESAAFPDNWSIGLSFYHNLFSREHNLFVNEFRKQAAQTPIADSGLRNPNFPNRVIAYQDVTSEELFEVGRLVVSAEVAKIHTIEWTTQLLYDEPLYIGMNGNWHGVFSDHRALKSILGKIAVKRLGTSDSETKASDFYSIFASGAGIVGLGSNIHGWKIDNADHINGGVNHFGSPFNFPEDFVSVYRLHPLIPDLIEMRIWDADPNDIAAKTPVVETFRHKATAAMHGTGLANWALSMGRQRLGLLNLQNHPMFLQNLKIERLPEKLDVAALDIIRDRERGIPRFNEFRRQIGLKQLTSFDDFIDRKLSDDDPERRRQQGLAVAMREIYGQHRCDDTKVISRAQLSEGSKGKPITDCLGFPNGSIVDNVEDIDLLVGWLGETTRPHGFAISETQFHVFIINASRRLFSDRFFTSSYRPEFYSTLGLAWVNDNGPNGKLMEKGKQNGHEDEVSPLKRILLRTMPELSEELEPVVNIFDPWARDRGAYYSVDWKPRAGAESDEAFTQ